MIIYKVTNLINNKIYIGQTIKSLEKRKKQHIYVSKTKRTNVIFHKELREFKEENFIWEIIDNSNNINCLNKKEKFWINNFNSLFPNGYNLLPGGNNKNLNEATKKIISNKAKIRMNELNRKKFMSDFQKNRIKLGLNKICKKGKEHPNTKNILKISMNENIILEVFESSFIAQEKTKINQSDIIKCCNNKNYQAGKFFWCYEKDYNEKTFEKLKTNYENRHNYCSIKIIIKLEKEKKEFLSIKKASKFLNISDVYLSNLIKKNGSDFIKKIKGQKYHIIKQPQSVASEINCHEAVGVC